MKNLMIVLCVMLLAIGCSSQKTSTDTNERRPPQGERREPPSIDELFKMDVNQDSKLSKSEVEGPIQRDFAKIDSDGDGFITRTELENAPKPQRGPRPPKN